MTTPPSATIRLWSEPLNCSLTNYQATNPIYQAYDSVDDAIAKLTSALLEGDDKSPPVATTEGQIAWVKMVQGKAFRDYAILCLRVGVPVSLVLPAPEDPIQTDTRPEHGILSFDEVDDPSQVYFLVNMEHGMEHGFWKPSNQLCGLDAPPLVFDYYQGEDGETKVRSVEG